MHFYLSINTIRISTREGKSSLVTKILEMLNYGLKFQSRTVMLKIFMSSFSFDVTIRHCFNLRVFSLHI